MVSTTYIANKQFPPREKRPETSPATPDHRPPTTDHTPHPHPHPHNTQTMTAAPTPIKLQPPGQREVVSPERAQEFVAHWTHQLLEHRAKVEAAGNADAANTVLCDRISLTDKSYTPEAAQIIADFLREPFHGGSPIAFGIVEADLTDMIASQLTAQGLKVLQTICDAFADSELVDVDLSDNAVGEQGAKYCKTVLSKSSLKRLAMCNMGLGKRAISYLLQSV